MKRKISLFVTIAFLLTQTGCASIVSGRQQDISVRSNPEGAAVEIDGMPVGKTPVTTEVKRKRRHQIKLTKEGYMEETRSTKRGFNWWFIGNVLIGGIIGIIVDFSTGAVYSVSPEELNIKLTEGQTTPSATVTASQNAGEVNTKS